MDFYLKRESTSAKTLLSRSEPLRYEAGILLRKLHNNFKGSYFGIPTIDGTPYNKEVHTDSVQYIIAGLETILKDGYDKQVLDSHDKSYVEWCINHSDVFNKPVPTNWDYSQNNWMVDKNRKMTGIIDFENMLWGIDVDNFGFIIKLY